MTAGFLSLEADLTNLTSDWPDLVRRLGDLRADLERAVSLCAEPDRHLCAELQPRQLTLNLLDVGTVSG